MKQYIHSLVPSCSFFTVVAHLVPTLLRSLLSSILTPQDPFQPCCCFHGRIPPLLAGSPCFESIRCGDLEPVTRPNFAMGRSLERHSTRVVRWPVNLGENQLSKAACIGSFYQREDTRGGLRLDILLLDRFMRTHPFSQ
jgi:hypothetical protein